MTIGFDRKFWWSVNLPYGLLSKNKKLEDLIVEPNEVKESQINFWEGPHLGPTVQIIVGQLSKAFG